MYDEQRADDYWTKRVGEVDQFRAVLTYDAPKYINESYSLWELNSVFRNLPKSLNNLKVLDISCGVGRISIPLAKKGALVTGIDISKGMISTCKKIIEAERLTSKVTLYQCNAANISTPNRYFDIVLCLGLLEHLPNIIRKKVLDELERTIKISGTAIVLVNNEDSIFLKNKKRYLKTTQNEKGYFSGLVNKEKIRKYLIEKGFSAIYVACNPLHSTINHLLIKKNEREQDKLILSKLFNYLAKIDLDVDVTKETSRMFSDHFMIKATKTK